MGFLPSPLHANPQLLSFPWGKGFPHEGPGETRLQLTRGFGELGPPKVGATEGPCSFCPSLEREVTSNHASHSDWPGGQSYPETQSPRKGTQLPNELARISANVRTQASLSRPGHDSLSYRWSLGVGGGAKAA